MGCFCYLTQGNKYASIHPNPRTTQNTIPMNARTTDQSRDNDRTSIWKTPKFWKWVAGIVAVLVLLTFVIRWYRSDDKKDQVAETIPDLISLTPAQLDSLINVKMAAQNKPPVDGGAGQQEVASTTTVMTGDAPLVTPTTIIFKDGSREFGYVIQEITPPTAAPVNK